MGKKILEKSGLNEGYHFIHKYNSKQLENEQYLKKKATYRINTT